MLNEARIEPWKGRGQNFLLDEKVIDQMVAAAGIERGSAAVEIGPGAGVLTGRLLERGARVAAVEIDPRLCSFLRRRFDKQDLQVLEGDALAFTNAALAEAAGGSRSGYRVVANIPYAITSALIQKFLLEAPQPASFTLMVQAEVADRVLAAPGEMSSLAVLVQTLAQAALVVRVPRASFYPAPQVDSAVIHIKPFSSAELSARFGAAWSAERHFRVTRAAFQEPRKQIKNTLRQLGLSDILLNEAIISASLKPESRPQELSVSDWARLSIELAKRS
ncbi:MAG: 16S rRNA (adenine(1518)-N(6)/adenine(1519)-N(6))-dimethyltransferase RsmA [Patescibacteria group bacterium]